MTEPSAELPLYRKLATIAGAVYLLWWFAVQIFLPHAFNPIASRLAVVSYFFSTLALSYVLEPVRRNLRIYFIAGLWLLTLHYYYLFYGNAGDLNWVVGAYITVIAINVFLLSEKALLSYSLYVIALSGTLAYLMPPLRESVFLPGIFTIVLQANLGLRSRLSLIKNLRESTEQFQLLFNSTFEGVVVHQDGKIVNVNDAFLRLTGFSRRELIGSEPFGALHPDDRPVSLEKSQLPSAAPYESRVLTKDGGSIDVELRGKDFEYGRRPARLVTVQDIRDRKRAEHERVAALALAENVRARDEFISIASHELKTPISALSLQAQLIEADFRATPSAEWPDLVKEAMALFDRQLKRLNELVETMLDVSRISGGRFTIEWKTVDLVAVVREIMDHLPLARMGLNPSITLDLPPSAELRGDSRRLEQVVENLLTNAVKYGNGKPILVRVRQDETETRLEVKDQGLGIAPENQEKIFHRFERAISARNISGFGLGLYIVKQIVDAHGGTVGVESRLGEGATFTVRLPRKASAV